MGPARAQPGGREQLEDVPALGAAVSYGLERQRQSGAPQEAGMNYLAKAKVTMWTAVAKFEEQIGHYFSASSGSGSRVVLRRPGANRPRGGSDGQ